MITATSKVCKKCAIEKPAADFPLNKKLKGGLNTYCRQCERDRMRAKRAAGPTKKPPKNKLCSVCNIKKPVEEMCSNRASSDGVGSKCKECEAARGRRKYYNDVEKSRKQNREKAVRNKTQRREYYKRYYPNNKEKYNERAKTWRFKNKRRVRAISKRYRDNNLEACKEAVSNYYRKNADKIKKQHYNNYWLDPEKHRHAVRKWIKNNRARCTAYTVRRNMDKLNRTPPWLTEEDYDNITLFYRVANRLTEITEELWAVDHIIPLRGVHISGLHCPANLQLIPQHGHDGNASKGNRWDPYWEVKVNGEWKRVEFEQ